MRGFLLFLLALALTLNASAALAPPAAVKAAFTKHFAFVKGASWKETDGTYTARYKVNGRPSKAVFTANGQLIESQQFVPATELPTEAASFLAVHYPGERIREVVRISDPLGRLAWEAAITGRHGVLRFDEEGHFLRESKGETRGGRP